MATADLKGWAPIRMYWRGGHPFVDWCDLRGIRLTEPFFDHTIDRCLESPFRLLFRHQTPIEEVVARQRERTGPTPSGFVFHMSRCGSTLVAQMFAALPAVVISEASVIDAVLRHDARAGVPDDQRIEWLQAILGALGQSQCTEEPRVIVKFEAWHAIHLPLIRRAFPNVPWVFLYRNPIEVLVSLSRMGGGRLVPGAIDPAWLDLDLSTALQLPPEQYHARVLGRICDAAAANHRPQQSRLVHYRELPEVVWSDLAGRFGVHCSEADVRIMQERARFDAKSPGGRFAADSAQKQGAASDALRAAAQGLKPLYAALEALCPSSQP